MHNYKTELLEVLTKVLNRSATVDVSNIIIPQDAMLNLHIDWQALQERLRSRKVDGFEPAIEKMIHLATTAMTMAAALSARMLNQVELQKAREAEEAETRESSVPLNKRRKWIKTSSKKELPKKAPAKKVKFITDWKPKK